MHDSLAFLHAGIGTELPIVMGIVNAMPDSVSDGGRHRAAGRRE